MYRERMETLKEWKVSKTRKPLIIRGARQVGKTWLVKEFGKNLLDKIDQLIRTAYFDEDDEEEKRFAMDYIWYLWCGPDAPSFDKDKMATFERYFIADKSLHKETKGYYYALRNKEEICDRILEEFGVTGQHTHIINGHVPVKTIKGEQPMKAGG